MRRFMRGAVLGILVLLMGAMTAMAGDTGFTDIVGIEQENAIIVVCDQQLMNGINEAQFLPEGQLTRAQLAVVLQRTFELCGKDVALPEGMYVDVAADSWYAEAVRACAANGVFAYADEFGADEVVPRSELAVCIQQAFAARQINIPMTMQYPIFEDTEDLTSQELMAVIFVNNTGIMLSANGYFRPYEAVTRAELAQTLLQVVELTAVTEDNDEVWELIPGRSLVVSLPANASTGYQWMNNEWDETILSKVSENYLPKSSEPLMAGQGGVKLWKFEAEKAGTVELVFTYSRPWESFQPAKTVRLTIVVDDPARMVALGSTRIVSQNAGVESQLTIPVIRGMENAAAQKELNQAVQAEALKFYETINSQAINAAEDAARFEAEFGRSFLPYQVQVSFTPGAVNDRIISYYLDCYQYMGGAHGMTARSSHSIDPVSGQELSLKDFFVTGYDYVAAINEQIIGQINNDTEAFYFDTAAEEAKIAADAVNFYVTAQGLVFYYQQYELAPYAAGILEYTIPFELLEEGLKR